MNVRRLRYLNPVAIIKTVWFNFRYLPLRQAWRMPVFLTSYTEVYYCHRGGIRLEGKIRTSMLTIGFESYSNKVPSFLRIEGELVVRGDGYHSVSPGAVLIIDRGATLTIGDNFYVGKNWDVNCTKRIEIGDNNLWSYGIRLRDSDGHSIVDTGGNLLNQDKEVKIGDYVWMGCGCTVLKGASVPKNSVIGANSLINSHLPPPPPHRMRKRCACKRSIWSDICRSTRKAA